MKYVPDVIISDVMMPGIDGIECCRRLKGELQTCHIPVILLTACSLDEQRIQGYAGGADSYISKPFSSQLLLTRIRNLIESRQRMKQFFGDRQTLAKEDIDVYKRQVMDRTKSGIVDFGKDSAPHAIEAHDRRKQNSINYVDDFALGTWAPVQKAGNYKLDIFVDKCSVEIFLNGGKIAMTNLIFPTTPYNQMSFYSRGGAFKVDRCKIYRL